MKCRIACAVNQIRNRGHAPECAEIYHSPRIAVVIMIRTVRLWKRNGLSNNRVTQLFKSHNGRFTQVSPLLMSGPSTLTTTTALRASIGKHNEVFESLLRLIPAKHYLARDAEEEEEVSKALSSKVKMQNDMLFFFFFFFFHSSSSLLNIRRIPKRKRTQSKL